MSDAYEQLIEHTSLLLAGGQRLPTVAGVGPPYGDEVAAVQHHGQAEGAEAVHQLRAGGGGDRRLSRHPGGWRPRPAVRQSRPGGQPGSYL